MSKPTKWLCAQRRLRSAWASAQSESSLCAHWVAKDPSFLHADSEDSDQTGRKPRLVWVFAGRTCHFVGFVTRRLNYIQIISWFYETGFLAFALMPFVNVICPSAVSLNMDRNEKSFFRQFSCCILLLRRTKWAISCIMALFVLRKLILQPHMRSHPVGLDVWFLVGPFVYFHTSCVRTAKALTRLHGCAGSPEPSLVSFVISTIISGAGLNYHQLVCRMRGGKFRPQVCIIEYSMKLHRAVWTQVMKYEKAFNISIISVYIYFYA